MLRLEPLLKRVDTHQTCLKCFGEKLKNDISMINSSKKADGEIVPEEGPASPGEPRRRKRGKEFKTKAYQHRRMGKNMWPIITMGTDKGASNKIILEKTLGIAIMLLLKKSKSLPA